MKNKEKFQVRGY